MKKKYKIVLATVAIAAVIIVSMFLILKYVPIGERARFVGTWQGKVGGIIPQGITLFSDGTGSLSGGSLTWELREGKLVLYSSGGEATLIYDYTFSNNDNTLTLKDVSSGLETVYTKQ